MDADTNDWRELREFAGVDLCKSYVLSWEHVSSTLMIDIDLCLTPSHPFFEEPRPAERQCIRPAMLEFPYCTALAGHDDGLAIVAAGLGVGRIDGLRRVGDGHYEIQGAFGTVAIDGERPILRLKGPVG